MKYHCVVILFCLLTKGWAQFNPQPNEVTEKFFPDVFELEEVTPGLQKSKGFTTYNELMDFLNGLKIKFPELVRIEYIGTSKKGKDIPIIYINNARQSGKKIRVFLQGGLHGDEPASTESVLYLLYDFLHNDENAELRENIELAVIPMANIDGYVRLRRNNAENLDLNRDQTKLMAHESVALKKAFTDFNPHVALDFHEFRPFRRDFIKMGNFGVTGAFDLMFLYSGNLNVPQALREHTNTNFLEPTRKILDILELSHFDYVTSAKHFGEIQFNRGSHNARSSATNYALLNTVAALIEVRGVGIGRTSYKRRVFSGYIVGKSFLQQAVIHKESTFSVLEETEANNEITVLLKRDVYQGELEVIDLETNEKISLNVTYRDALRSSPQLIRPRPKAYYISCDERDLVTKLRTLGLIVDTIKVDEEVEIERYLVTNRSTEGQKYEKMTLQSVQVELETKKLSIPAGSFIVYTNQENANILTEVMEPEAPNSFVSFGLIKTRVNQYLPIYRLP